MGHLFSRAFKRLTQSGSSSSSSNQTTRNSQSTQANQQEQQDKDKESRRADSRPLVESIPVGQSIDSGEYRALESGYQSAERRSSARSQEVEEQAAVVEAEVEAEAEVEVEDEPAEKAAIKIQALVRGHLTRKALKDAHQHSAPLPTALGQSQFDEQSLTQNPPSAVFLSATNVTTRPTDFHLSPTQTQLAQLNKQSSSSSDLRSPLESIAELIESQALSKTDGDHDDDESQLDQEKGEEEEEDLSSDIRIRSGSGSAVNPPAELRRVGSASVAGSARASIDLSSGGGGETSASILISDHNVKPTELFASVLHQAASGSACRGAQAEGAEQARPRIGAVRAPEPVEEDEGVAALGSPDSLESEEAAAIRIQSAFRGYRTRKNSPYRTRSPIQSSANQGCSTHSSPNAASGGGAAADEEAELHLRLSAHEAGRRESRPRGRGSSGERQTLGSLEPSQSGDEPASAEDDTVKEQLQDARKSGELSLLDERRNSSPSAGELEAPETSVRSEDEPLDELAKAPSVSSAANQPRQQQQQKARAHSDSLATDDTLDELALSAALEGAPTSATNDDLPASIGAKSDASIELDTDSSVLGAALSLSEADASLAQLNQLEPIQSDRLELVVEGEEEDEAEEADGEMELELDEDRSPGEPKLISADDEEQSCESGGSGLVDQRADWSNLKLEAATNELEAALDEVLDDEQQTSDFALNEQEQLAIELESDDIERRDPRGFICQDRAKSPQIGASGQLPEAAAWPTPEPAIPEASGENLQPAVPKLELPEVGEQPLSGQSTPALNSSTAGNSSASDADSGDEAGQSPQPQQAGRQQHQQSNNKTNKRRNNRNKRKGKK